MGRDLVGDAEKQAKLEAREHAKQMRHKKFVKWIFVLVAVFSLVMLVAWGGVQRNSGIPLDFGPLTAIVLFLLVGFLFSLKNAIYRFYKDLKMPGRRSVMFNIMLPVTLGGLLLLAGSFELRHQLVQVIATPPTQMVSGKPNALFKCERLLASMIPNKTSTITRKGFVSGDDPNVTVARSNTCQLLFDWYVFDRRSNTSEEQAFALDLVAHEAIHVGGETNELKAKCGAVEWIEDVAIMMGASEEEAQRISKNNEEWANEYKGNPLIQQSLQYEGHCSDVPSVREGR